MPQKFSNNATSTLAVSVTADTDDVLTLATGTGDLFPVLGDGDYFYLRIGTDAENEIVMVVERNGDDLTLDDVVSSDWGEGAIVMQTCCAQMLGDFIQTDANGQSLVNVELYGVSESSGLTTVSSNSVYFSPASHNTWRVVLTENITTFNFANVPASPSLSSLTIFFIQDATGGRTVTWPANVLWQDGAPHVMSPGANAVDIVTLMTVDGGTTWYGMVAGADFS